MAMFDGLGMDWGLLATGVPTPGMDPMTPPQSAPQNPNFNDRFGAAFPRSPISPENLASNLAARGVPPPPVDIPPQSTNVGAALTGSEQPYRLAGPEAMDEWRNSVDVKNAGGPTSMAAAQPAPGAPAPMNIQSPVQEQQVAEAGAPTDVSASKKGPADSLLDALKGVKAPAAPELQRLGTPAAPRPTGQVKSGQLLALLQALNVGQPAGQRDLPSTLAGALRRG